MSGKRFESMSLEEMLVTGAVERELDSSAALKLHAHYKAKYKGLKAKNYPAQFSPAYQNHNQASHCW